MVEDLLADARDQIQPEARDASTGIQRVKDKLTPACRAVLDLAHHEAGARGATHLACEHLLLALATRPESASCRLLSASALGEDEIRARLGFVQGRFEQGDLNGSTLPLSPRTTRVMLAAEKECQKRGLDRIGTLHLLSALMAEREGLAVFILEEPGVGLERLGSALQRAFRDKWEDEEGVEIRD